MPVSLSRPTNAYLIDPNSETVEIKWQNVISLRDLYIS